MNTKLKYFKLAKELNEKWSSKFIEKQAHCRGNINSMSLISLNYQTPEMAFATNINEDNIEHALENKPKKPSRSVPEKVLQANIINKAINNKNHYLPFGDKIKFITSEMAIGDDKVVNDLLGFSEEKGLYIIELKSERAQTDLINQVCDFQKIVEKEPNFFIELLNDIYGCNWDGKTIQKAIVWPYCENPQKSTNQKFIDNDKGIIEEYCYNKDKLGNQYSDTEGSLVIT